MREQGRAVREHGGATREHTDETGVSARAEQRRLSQQLVTCWPEFGDTIYVYSYELRYFQMAPTASLRTITKFLVEFTEKLPHCLHTIVLQAPHGRRDNLAR